MYNVRILIAEDQDVFRRGLRSLLEDRREWTVCGDALNGAEAIEKTRGLRPDVVLLDVTMPDVDAARAIPQIIEAHPAVKIVALATQGSAESGASALAAGASGLALKSDDAAELVLTVERISSGRPSLSPGAVTMIQGQLVRRMPILPMLQDLTPREIEVLSSLARGRNNKEIASTLGVSVKTVNAHRANMMRTLKLRSYSGLVEFASRSRIVDV
jgi:DNA-binding NarL/FixJ family response regulator